MNGEKERRAAKGKFMTFIERHYINIAFFLSTAIFLTFAVIESWFASPAAYVAAALLFGAGVGFSPADGTADSRPSYNIASLPRVVLLTGLTALLIADTVMLLLSSGWSSLGYLLLFLCGAFFLVDSIAAIMVFRLWFRIRHGQKFSPRAFFSDSKRTAAFVVFAVLLLAEVAAVVVAYIKG